jgi:threonine synthase
LKYQSTRDSGIRITATEAIAQGISADGGLFVPVSFPVLTGDAILDLASKSYVERAAFVLGLFLDGFSGEELERFSGVAYGNTAFSHPSVAPLHRLDGNTHFLELWHGPTCAFKDMALQMLPHLLTASMRKADETRSVCILVATSGDTGKAALEGFCDVPGTRIMVFYPKNGVSDIQELQMTTQRGENVNVVAVDGNFDDAQTGVKAIFSDENLRSELDGNGIFLSSANSINWGRLVPQITYYVSAYCDLLAKNVIKYGEKVNFCVPTGNFGNILAAWYAERIGLPVNKLICASNRNDVLTQFFGTGVYDKNRQFFTTVSPSMDILVSSNLERLLFETSGKDSGAVSAYMSSLSKKGRYEVAERIKEETARVFAGGCCSEKDTKQAIADTYEKYNYLIDTHTAVAYKVLLDYRASTRDETPSVVVSTASPFKFCDSVLDALGAYTPGDCADLIDALAGKIGCAPPAPLTSLRHRAPRFTDCVPAENMKAAVKRFLM